MATSSTHRSGPQLPLAAKYAIGIVGAISVIVFLYATHHHDMWMRQITKPWPVVGLILLAAEATLLVPHRTNVSVLFALIFCVLGDILLEIEGMFLHGLVAFLIGHLGYIYAFGTLAIARNKLLYIPFFIYVFSFYWLCYDKLGDLHIPVVLYTIVLGLMAGGAAGTFHRGKASQGTLTALLIPVGATLFTLSDSLIAVNRFYNTNTWSLRYVIILTYWAGQLLITLGSLRLMSEPQKAKKQE